MSTPLYTVLELVPEGKSTVPPRPDRDVDENVAVTPTDPEVDEITKRWLHAAFIFEKSAGPQATRILEIPHQGRKVELTVRLGTGLLEDLVYAYGMFGCAGLDAALAQPSNPQDARRRARASDEEVAAFVAKTHRVVTELVILGLDRIERAAIQFARRKWTAAARKLDEYERLTRAPHEGEGKSRQFTDFWFGSDAYHACAAFARHRRVYKHIEESMDEWPTSRGKDPGSPYRPLWVDKERQKAAALRDLTSAVRHVGTYSPALILALDRISDDFGADPDDKDFDKRQLADYLFFQVRDLREDTRQLLDGLDEGPHAKKALSFALTLPGQQQLLAVGGLERWLLDGVLSDTEQRVLLNETLLHDMANPEAADSTVQQGTWEWFVLGVHLRDMRALAEEKATREAAFRTIWDWLIRIAALLSLVVFAVTTFGLGAAVVAGSAAAAFIATAGTVVTFLALSMTAIEAAYALAVERAALTREISDKLHLLAVGDPAAVAAIGHLLSARQAITTGLLKEVALMVVTMGASKIRRVARALDVYGAIEDMQVLFAPLPTSTPAGTAP